MEEIKEALSYNLLQNTKYYDHAVKMFKIIIKKDIKWIALLLFLRIASILVSSFQMGMPLYLFINVVLVSILNSFILNNVIGEIESHRELTYSQVTFKAFILLILEISIMVFLRIAAVSPPVLSIPVSAAVLIIFLNILYLHGIYISRKKSIVEAVRHSIELCKETRWKYIVTILPIILLSNGFAMLERSGRLSVIILILLAVPAVITAFYVKILQGLIYLNADYMYNKKDENKID